MSTRGTMSTRAAAVRVVSTILAFSIVLQSVSGQLPFCPAGFANFGDSLTDTGNALDSFPFLSDAELSPYGETFFGAPAKRFCNGRLVTDFFSLAFRKPLLDAYFSVASFNYKNGVNFAVAGATAAFSPTSITPFSVYPLQVNQFIRFKNSVFATDSQPLCVNFFQDLPSANSPLNINPFPTWLYTIEAGGNDLLNAFEANVPPGTISSVVIPQAIGNLSLAIQTLYAEGARKFLVFNVPPQGCSTVILTLLGGSGLPTDSLGCIIPVNQVVQGFNAGLNASVIALRANLTGANISLFDYYSANIEILTHPTTYGFNASLTTTACCGAPGVGTLNYNPAITCGHPGSNNCSKPDTYVIWDGVHFTEAFYRTISTFALDGNFTDHGVNYTANCFLDFSLFGPTVTFPQAYPRGALYNNLFT